MSIKSTGEGTSPEPMANAGLATRAFRSPDSACLSSFALEHVFGDDGTGMNESAVYPNPDFPLQPILRAFARALDLARAHEGATAPNPPIGCVLLDAKGLELAVGAHRRAGQGSRERCAGAR